MVSFLIQLLNAVQYGRVLFLVASGLTLIFGIMRIINLAHGSFYMVGAYLAFALSGQVTDTMPGMLVVGSALAFAFGFALEWLFFSFLYQRDHLEQVLLTYGLIINIALLHRVVFALGGALAAAMVIACADVFGKLLLPAYAGMFVYLVMAAVLLWRAEGIFRKG